VTLVDIKNLQHVFTPNHCPVTKGKRQEGREGVGWERKRKGR